MYSIGMPKRISRRDILFGAGLSPLAAVPINQALGLSGAIAPGARLHAYRSGTEIAQNVYTSSRLATPHANPVAAGRDGLFPAIYLDPALRYRLVLETAHGGGAQMEVDPVSAATADALRFVPAGTGASARSVQDKLRETVSIKDFGAAGNGTANDTAAFARALAFVQSLPRGGEIYLPPGVYVMDMDVSMAVSDFERRVRIRGAGRGVTQIKPTRSGAIMLNMMGRSQLTVQDLTFYAGDSFQAMCAVYASRCAAAGDCNNNKFLNVEIWGNYSAHAVIWCGAESSLWLNCRIAPNVAGRSAFWAGSDPALCGVTPPSGRPIEGPCSDNRMIACETYGPFNGIRHLTFSKSCEWTVVGHGFIGGTANNQRLVTFADLDHGVFLGPVHLRDCHYEVFGTGNVGLFVDNPPGVASNWYGISSTGGYACVDSNFLFMDFNRTALAGGGPALIGSTFAVPTVPPGITSGLPLLLFNVIESRIDWEERDGNGLVVVLGFAARTPIHCAEPRIAQLNECDAPLWRQALPTSGTYARGQRIHRSYGGDPLAPGDAVAWLCTDAGTWGQLAARRASGAAGSNRVTMTVDSSDIKVGQLVKIGDGQYRVAATRGATVYLTANLTAALSGAAVGYAPGGSPDRFFRPWATIG